jgi:FkbM family methyltransferase
MALTQVINDLIYDVGMHNGNDTAFYLHQGFRVLAMDADPIAVEAARRRFSSELTSRRLTLLNVGIADRAGRGKFWICEGNSAWNSFHLKVSSRLGLKHHPIEIDTRPFTDILDEYGVPVYLKVDIEGNDYLCIQDLAGRSLPPFISVEAENTGDDEDLSDEEALATLYLLRDAGYRKFKLISQYDFTPQLYSDIAVFSQRLLNSAANGRLRVFGLSFVAKRFTFKDFLLRTHRYEFPLHSSGPWGEGTPGRWLSFQQAEALHKRARERHFNDPNINPFRFDISSTPRADGAPFR